MFTYHLHSMLLLFDTKLWRSQIESHRGSFYSVLWRQLGCPLLTPPNYEVENVCEVTKLKFTIRKFKSFRYLL